MAKKTKKKAEKSTLEIAQELLDIRRDKNQLITLDKALTTELKRRIKDGDSGQSLFVLDKSRSIKVANQEQAVAWAQQNYPHIITVDTKAAKVILQREFNLPEGFEVTETEKLVAVDDKESNDE